MKKLLSLITISTMVSATSTQVISCSKKTTNETNKLSDAQINASAYLSKLTIMSQSDNANLSEEDAMNILTNTNGSENSIKKNLDSLFLSDEYNNDFDPNSKIKINDNNVITEDTAMIPEISALNSVAPGLSKIPNLLQILATSFDDSFSGMISPLIISIVKLIAPDYGKQGADISSELMKIFSNEIISSNGTILKNTIGNSDGTKLTIDSDSIYSGKTYSEVLSNTMTNLSDSITKIINKINLNKDDYHNIAYGLLVIINYLSQFNFANKISSSTYENGQILYNTTKTSNALYKGSILNEKYSTLNISNFANFFTNMENNDSNDGLGFRQLIFTILGSSNDGTTTTNFNEQEISKPIKALISGLLPNYSGQIPIVFQVLGSLLGDSLSQNLTFNNVIPVLSAAGGITKNDGINKLVSDLESNSGWYVQNSDTSVLGTTWDDLWSGTKDNKNALFNLIETDIQTIIGSNISLLNNFENLNEAYKIIENLNLPTVLKYLNVNVNFQSLLSLKGIFNLLGNDSNLLGSLFSPTSIKIQTNLLKYINDPATISKMATDFNDFTNKIIKNGNLYINSFDTSDNSKNIKATKWTDIKDLSFLSKLQNNKEDNVLSYLSAYAIVDNHTDTKKDPVEQSDYTNFVSNFIDGTLGESLSESDKNNPNFSDIKKLFSNLDNSINIADKNIFWNEVSKNLDSSNWSIGSVTSPATNTYQYVLSEIDKQDYQVTLKKDNDDNYYTISINEITNEGLNK